jgi:hypothetical protein
MARMAHNVTLIRFANGRELMVQPSPDEVVRAIDHRPRRRRKASAAEAGEGPSQRLATELAALADAAAGQDNRR